jgi:hypothetical protein
MRRPTRVCSQCACTYPAPRRGPLGRFCSMSCARRARHLREYAKLDLAPRPCRTCGTLFKPTGPLNVCCSARCRQRSRCLKLEPRICLACQGVFQPKRNRTRYCSNACAQKAYRVRLKARL